jgi:Domain of unknown function (DUF4349)
MRNSTRRGLAALVPLAALTFSLTACAKSEREVSSAEVASTPFLERAQDAPAASGQAVARPAAPAIQRKLIRTGRLSIEVASYERAAAAAGRVAVASGGYLAESQVQRGERDSRRGTLTLRVPAEHFDAAFGELKKLGTVDSESVSTQDVTKAYTDLETRLRVKREAQARLQEILSARTAKLSDVLEAERELARITEETEVLEGERRFYDQQIALSTITVELYEPAAVVRPGSFAPLSQALSRSLELLATSLALLISATLFLLPWLIVTSLLWWGVRAARRRRPPTGGKGTG